MENLHAINEERHSIMLVLDEIEQMYRSLDKVEQTKKINKMQEDWKNLLKIAQTVDKDISIPVKNETDKTKDKIKKFEESLKEYFMGLKKESFYIYKTGIEDSFKRINEVNKSIEEFETKLKDYEYYAKMFNFPDEVIGCSKNLDMIKSEILAVSNLWNHIRKCDA